jgi:hypothetical protein
MRRRGDESRRPQNHRHQDEEGWIESDFMRWMMLMMRAVTFRNIKERENEYLENGAGDHSRGLAPSPTSTSTLLLPEKYDPARSTPQLRHRNHHHHHYKCKEARPAAMQPMSCHLWGDPWRRFRLIIRARSHTSVPLAADPRPQRKTGSPSRGLTEENVFIKAPVNRTWIHERRRPHAPARLDDCPPRESKQLWSL